MSYGTPSITPTGSTSSLASPINSPAQQSRVPVLDIEELQNLYSTQTVELEDLSTAPLNFGVELEFNARLKEKGLELFYHLQTYHEDDDPGAVSDSSSSTARTATARSSTSDFEWEDIADVIKAVLEQCCSLQAKISSLQDPNECYDHWIVRKEFSIEADDSGFFGVELVTPVLTTNTDWKYVLHIVLEELQEHLELVFSRDCGAHIHLSPLHGRWSLPAVKNLAKAVVYFEPILETLLPPERCNNLWCSSNTLAPQVTADLQASDASEKPVTGCSKANGVNLRPDFKQTFTHISTFPTLSSLINYISPDKCHSWNFKHITPGAKCGTIEFRRPLMAQDSTVLIRWVLFCVGFVRAAQSSTTKWDVIERFQTWPGIEALHAYVLSGLTSQDGELAFKILDGLFENRDDRN